MARSRNIKPAFFINELLVELPYEYRLLFIGLWTLADREGRLGFRPRKIKMSLYPADDVDVKKGINELASKGFLFIYHINDQSYIQINNWSKHQNPHHKEVRSEIPRYDESIHGSSITHGTVNHTPNTVCDGYIPLSDSIREKIYNRDGEKCNYCGETNNLHIDHIKPVSLGGNSVDENLQVLCLCCNMLKSNHIVNQELSILHGRVMLDSSVVYAQPNKNASCPTDTLNPITDSLNPLPVVPPPGLNQQSWERFFQYRKDIKKPIKQASVAAAQKKLAAFGAEQAAVVEQTIANGWQGLFSVSVDKSSRTVDSSRPLSAVERVERANRERAAARKGDAKETIIDAEAKHVDEC